MTLYGMMDEYTEVYYGNMDAEGRPEVFFKTFDLRDYLHYAYCRLPSRDFYDKCCSPEELELYRAYLDEHAEDIMKRAFSEQ